MRRFFIAMVTVVLMTSAVFLSGCSLGTPDRETELKDTLSDTQTGINSDPLLEHWEISTGRVFDLWLTND